MAGAQEFWTNVSNIVKREEERERRKGEKARKI